MNKKVLVSWPRPFDPSPLFDAFPDAQFKLCPLGEPGIFEAAADAQIWVAGGPALTSGELAAARNLEWVQLFGAGLSPAFFAAEFRNRGVLVSNARGVNVVNMAEHVMAYLFAFARALPQFAYAQAKRHWIPYTNIPALFEIHGQTIGIVGFGAIGRGVAARARAMGMRVWAIRRHPEEEDFALVDRMMPSDALHELLAAADHVVLTVPLDDSTRGMIGAKEFAAMKRGAYIHNVGRGTLIDSDALIKALADGHLGGAGLDVTDPEPLPPESPLWTLPNVIVTPHAAGITPEFFPRTLAFIVENMRRYVAGDPPENLIDLTGGY